jgi:phage I-like protein
VPTADSINGRLISFAISNGAKDAKALPERLKLLSWGRNETVKGPVTVGPQTLKQLSANQKSFGFDHIALDYNHQTVPSSPNFKKDPVEVAAYGVPEVIEGDGLYLNITEWTESGRQHAGSYRDLSPTPQLNDDGEVIFLHSVALCRQGAVDGLTFYSASFLNPASLQPHTAMPTPALDPKTSLVTLLKTLGVTLPDNPTDAQIIDAATNFKPNMAATATMTPELKKFEERLVSLEAGNQNAARAAIVERATSAGKVIPLSVEEINQLSPAVLSSMVEKLPATVPLDSRTKPGATPAASGKVTTLTAEQRAICKRLNITEEKYLLTLQAEQPANLTVV